VESRPRFVILMHPLEARHPVGTGRLAHRSLSNSTLWVGAEFGEDSELGFLVRNPTLRPLLLFPGPQSHNLSRMSGEERASWFEGEREAVVIVIDATWDLAQKMLHHSPPLQRIERISFEAESRSRFEIRKQPRPECLSSVEAMERVLELVHGREAARPQSQNMMRLFLKMVAHQKSFSLKDRA